MSTNYFPFKKIVYFSNDALKSIKEGDEEMKEYYEEYLNRRIRLNDVYLYLDTHFKTLSPEQEAIFSLINKTNLWQEI